MELGCPQPGTIIAGKYRVERALGVGGMGVVLHATHIALHQGVALKLLHEHVAKNPEIVARFLREAQIAAQLPPEHIARVTDVGQTDSGEPYLVMELLTGRDVSNELIVRGPMPIAEAVDIVLEACQGVAEAHAVGLVHRDLKPANLFLAARRGEAPVVKVLDFGLSKSYEDTSGANLTTTTTSFGTPAYMSPEQIRSAKYVEPRSDQHALGMILFELLTGHAPYTAESVTGLAVVISTEPPPHARAERREVPEGLDAAICKAMGKRPTDRYPSLSGFAVAIAPYGGPRASMAAAHIAAVLGIRDRASIPPAETSARGSSPELSARGSGPDLSARPSGPEPSPRPSGPEIDVTFAPTPLPQNITHSPTTTDPGRKFSGSRAAPIAAAVAGLGVLLAIVIFFIGRAPESSPSQASPSSSAASPIDTSADARSSSAPIVVPSVAAPELPVVVAKAAPSAEPTAGASSSVTSPAPTTTAKASSTPRTPAPGPSTKPGGSSTKRPRDVFGGDK